jgi:cytochrome c oxidase assembly factor CtaG
VLVLLNKAFMFDIAYVDPNASPFYNFKTFSASYIALFEFVKLLSLSLKKDLTVFMKLGFMGATCVSLMITFVIIYGCVSINNTSYDFFTSLSLSPYGGKLWQDSQVETQDLLLFNTQFSNLAGVLCAGYFIH